MIHRQKNANFPSANKRELTVLKRTDDRNVIEKNRLLIVEADKKICESLSACSQSIGCDCLTVHTAADAMRLCRYIRFSLLLIDIALPDLDGFRLAQRLQPFGVPILFIAPELELSDRLRCFELGAAAILNKPLEMAELRSWLKAVLRRSEYMAKQILMGDVVIHFDERRVWKGGKEVSLTQTEYLLFEILLRNPNTVMPRETLLRLVWGYEPFNSSRLIDAHIAKLRKKLGLQNEIRTVYKAGYRLDLQAENIARPPAL